MVYALFTCATTKASFHYHQHPSKTEITGPFRCLSHQDRDAVIPLLFVTSHSRNTHRSTSAVDKFHSRESTSLKARKTNDGDDKFGFGQRIESVKSLAVGAVSGSLAAAPVIAFRDLFALDLLNVPVATNSLAQFEFDCDVAAVQAGLFAICYRYCIRTDQNEQLNDGVVGAFVLARALSRIVVPVTCSAIPLTCGPPLGVFDWGLLLQIGVNLAEAGALFGAAASAMNYCFYRKIISKFP